MSVDVSCSGQRRARPTRAGHVAPTARSIRSGQAAVAAAPASATPLEAVTAGLEAAGSAFPLELVRRRQALILANPELQERELQKLASLAGSLAQTLRQRGVPDTAAELAASTGITILRTTLARWVSDPTEQPWTVHLRATIDELRTLTGAGQV